MRWPEPEGKQRIPEGHYMFRLSQEPELLSFTYTDKQGTEKSGRKIKLYAIGFDDTGDYPVIDVIVAWEARYAELCEALGVEHGRDIQMAGATFDGDIKYEQDRKDPAKSWPRIINIKSHDGVPQGKVSDDGDIPF
jgi:hypothetical protein